jgi:imidazoleglycerol-phosphate dehydratase
LDEALSRCVLDFSGRPGLVYQADYSQGRLSTFDVDLLHEFFQGFVNHAHVTLHLDNIRGRNAHHIAETLFKAFGRAIRMAIEMDSRMSGIMPSTKGCL